MPAPAPVTAPAEAVTPVSVLRRFRVIFNAVRTHFREVEKQVGLGGAQVWALHVIQSSPGIGVGGIASQMDIHQSTASNLVKVLLRKSLVETTKSSTDKRNVHLQILPEGRALLARVSGPFEGVLPDALAKMQPDALNRLDLDLAQLIALLQADESAAEVPLAEL